MRSVPSSMSSLHVSDPDQSASSAPRTQRSRLVPWAISLLTMTLGSCQFPPLPDITDAPPDEDPPETQIDSSPAAIDRSTAASFTFSADEEATFMCSLDAGAPSACVSPYTRTVAAGAHVFRVVAIDLAGNPDPTPAEHQWTVDTAAPVTTISSAPPLFDNSTTVSFEFAANEESTFECATDAQAFQTCASPHVVTNLADGLHMFRVRATDVAQNVELSPPVHSWTIDASTPDTQIDTGPSGTTGSQTAAFSFSSSDAGAGATFTCEIDGGGFSPCTSPVTYNGLSEGTHTFRVRVRDAVGNPDPTPAVRNWTIDLTGPETTIVSGPTGSVASTSATFVFSSNESGTFECRLDAGLFAACPANHTIIGLSQGMHLLEVRGIDNQGNPDSSPAQRAWTVDTVMPTVSISVPAAGATTSGTVQVSFTVDEPATTTCRVDGGSFSSCASGVMLSLSTGAHTVDVRAVDGAGLMGTASRMWNVDATPPETTIDSGPSGSVATTSASIAFSSPESGTTFECNLDGAGYSTCASPHMLSGLAQGMHTLLVRAVDSVGNRDQSPASRMWIVDTIQPDTQIVSGPAANVRVAQASFDFASNESGVTYQCSLDGGTFAGCPDPYSIMVSNGSHELRVVAVDGAGNPDMTPALHAWTVDLPNLVFVTGVNIGGPLGGLAGADAFCQSRAQAAGLPGTYRAWLSTSTVNAIDRLGTASGWQRLDGRPFANTKADIAAGAIYYPILLPDTGPNDIGRNVITATASDGTLDTGAGTCNDWTTDNGSNQARLGVSIGTSGRFTANVGSGIFSVGCSGASIYCFGVDYTTTVTPPTPTARKAFITQGTWVPGGGLASADAVCESEATAASLSGTFKALLATSSEGGMSRFTASGDAWSRVDGPALTATASELVTGPISLLRASPNVTAAGAYISGSAGADEVWSGALHASSAFTCNDWTTAAPSQMGDGGPAAVTQVFWIGQQFRAPCDRARRLVCLQE